ncbi:MAG TPA: efflux RND transporter periplasmic adaptor subunit [Vicinamibacterales bacterium]
MTLQSMTVVLVAAVASGCTSREAAAPTSAPLPVAVETATVSAEDVPELFESGGVVRAAVTAEVVSRIMAPVLSVPVVAGTRVEANAPLVVLEGRQLEAELHRAQAVHRAAGQSGDVARAQLDRASAQLAVAQKTFERLSILRAKNSSTEQEVDRARADFDAAKADVEAARSAVGQTTSGLEAGAAAEVAAAAASSYTVLRAPFAGLVTETRIDPGSMAMPGAPLVILEDPRRFRLEVRVDEARLGHVRIGQAVRVRTGDGSRAGPPIDGRVAEISRTLDAAHTFTVKIDLPQSAALRSGVSGTASFEGALRQAMLVPSSSVVRRGQLTSVFAVDDGRARMRLVQLGGPRGDRLEVTAGLEPDETVIVRPDGVMDGSPVTVQPTTGAGSEAPRR